MSLSRFCGAGHVPLARMKSQCYWAVANVRECTTIPPKDTAAASISVR